MIIDKKFCPVNILLKSATCVTTRRSFHGNIVRLKHHGTRLGSQNLSGVDSNGTNLTFIAINLGRQVEILAFLAGKVK